MNRNFSLIFILLATLSIVNAIPLHKRAVAFAPCPIEPAVNPLTVTMDPADPVPGGRAKYTISGKLSKPAETGSRLDIGFFGEDKNEVGKPFCMDLCATNPCPIEEFTITVDSLPTPKELPERYDIIVAIIGPDKQNGLECATASDMQTGLGCATASVGPA